MKKKILLTLMVVMLSLIAFGTISASAETYGDLTYTISNGEVTITRCNRDATNIVVPETINGFPVVAIKEFAFQMCNGLTELVIPDSVTSVERYAFSMCDNLESVKIGDGLTTIEESTFTWCEKLSKVDIGSNIKTIGQSAFSQCQGLTEVYIPDNVEYIRRYAFSGTNIKNVHIGSGVKCIESSAFPYFVERVDIKDINAYLNIDFEEGTNLMNRYTPPSLYLNGNPITNVVIPDGVIHIPDYIFYGCDELESVTIPSSVKRIGEGAFKNCTSLTYVSIPDGVLFVDDYAFAGCNNIAELQIGNNVKSIGMRAFEYCENIKKLLLPDSIEVIAYRAFGDCNSLEEIYLGKNIKNIADYAFEDCNVKEVSISDIMFFYIEPSQGNRNFKRDFINKIVLNGSPITNVVIPDGVTYIPNNAFEYCSTLESVTIPEGVLTIGDSAFMGCDNLLEISIPYSTIEIGESAFAGCDKLESITILNNTTTIGDGAFSGTPYENENEFESQGVVYRGDVLVGVVDKTLSEYHIKEGTKSIGYAAFESCYNLESIVIPNSVTTIGAQAFRLCTKLKNIRIPDTVTAIEHSAFEETAYINDETNWENGIFYVGNHLIEANEDIVSCNIRPGTKLINNDAFSGCNQLETVIIPDGVARINDYAFRSCRNLSSVALPKSILYISPSAFQNCNNLTALHISDMDAYMNIDFGYSGAFNLSNPMFFADILHLNGELITSIVVPDYIDTIYSGAFDGCENLENITLSEGITSIGEAAFRGCYNLSSLTIPKSVKYINATNWETIKRLNIKDLKAYMEIDFSGTKLSAEEIYYQDKPLTELIVPDGITYITDDIFSWWNDYSSLLEKVVIPSSVKYIGEKAFSNCVNLKQVEFSKGLLFIDSYAFSGCHNITNVLYDGTKEEWDKILMCNGNSSIKRAQIQFNDVAKKSTKTTVSEDKKSFAITPINIENGKTVILALYDGEKFVEMQSAIYTGEEIPFTTTKTYTKAKVMIWDDITNLKPVCGVEEIN